MRRGRSPASRVAWLSTSPAGTSAAFFNDEAIAAFDPVKDGQRRVHSVSLTLYRASIRLVRARLYRHDYRRGS